MKNCVRNVSAVALVVAALGTPCWAEGVEGAQAPVEVGLEEAIRAGDVQRVLVREDGLRIGAVPQLPPIERAVDGEDDPPGLLAEGELGALQDLAQRLSDDRSWLRPEIVSALDLQDLHLDEIFVGAPELVRVGEELFRVQVEKVGPMWDGFDAEADPFFVFLTHEVFDGWGEDRALGYFDGTETVIFEADFQQTPAVAITLAKLPLGHDVSGAERIVGLGASFDLGAAELRLPLDRLPVELLAGLPLHHGMSAVHGGALGGADAENVTTCTQVVAPTACSNGVPVCGTGYSPYFVLTSLMIKTDHEGCCFKGNPEIELFPLRIDVASLLGSNTTAQTNLIFDGISTTDMAGRTRFLPNVNDNNVWYTVTNGLAIFPADLGRDWSALLVEQDDTTGVLRVKPTRINVTKLLKSAGQIIDSRSIDLTFLIKVGKFILDIIGIFNDGDDLYQESLGIGNDRFCSEAVGTLRTYHLVSQEWEMKGQFACINPSCPDPSTGGGGGGGTIGDCLLTEGRTLCP